jgi:hypothetical protein
MEGRELRYSSTMVFTGKGLNMRQTGNPVEVSP